MLIKKAQSPVNKIQKKFLFMLQQITTILRYYTGTKNYGQAESLAKHASIRKLFWKCEIYAIEPLVESKITCLYCCNSFY